MDENLYKVRQKAVLLGTARRKFVGPMDNWNNHEGKQRKTDYQDINREIQDQATKKETTQDPEEEEHRTPQSSITLILAIRNE